MKHSGKGIGILALFGIALLSCEDDPVIDGGGGSVAKIQFETAAKELDESASESTVVLQFSKPAAADATISLKAGDGYENTLNTAPAIENGFINLQVNKGDVSAEIKLSPVDNTVQSGNKVLTLSLHNLPSLFASGVNTILTITVKDDDTTSPLSVANFQNQENALEESNATGLEYTIQLSEAVTADSQIKIKWESENATYGVHFVTEPAAEGSLMTLPVSTGATAVTFVVKPVDNDVITGEGNVTFTIYQTEGSVTKGDNLEQALTIKDEELDKKPRGYEITSAHTTAKRFFEYDAQGRISKVQWENFTGMTSQGTDTYFYDGNDNLIKINKHAYLDVMYHWSEGRIVKSEEVSEGVVKSYTEYAYDEAGNIGGVVTYHRQPDGEYIKGLFTIYLYHLDGNLYKSLTYQDSNDPEEPTLISTRTYENYLDVSNPFPMTEVIPGIRSQTKLATTYNVQEAGVDLTYNLQYEYREDGLPAKRVATATGDVQTAVYYYY